MVLGLPWLTRKAGPLLVHGRVRLVEPARHHFEAWSLLRETSRAHLEPFEPAWPHDELGAVSYRRRLRRYRADRRSGTGAAFLVERIADDTLLGGVTLTNLRRGVTQSASVGYWIGSPFTRQGYASEALAAILGYAFNDLELNRIEAACLPSNRASLVVLERAGFRHEGLARSYLRINGTFQDHVLLARLRDDPPAGMAIRVADKDMGPAPGRECVHASARQLTEGAAPEPARAAGEGRVA